MFGLDDFEDVSAVHEDTKDSKHADQDAKDTGNVVEVVEGILELGRVTDLQERVEGEIEKSSKERVQDEIPPEVEASVDDGPVEVMSHEVPPGVIFVLEVPSDDLSDNHQEEYEEYKDNGRAVGDQERLIRGIHAESIVFIVGDPGWLGIHLLKIGLRGAYGTQLVAHVGSDVGKDVVDEARTVVGVFDIVWWVVYVHQEEVGEKVLDDLGSH